MRLPAAPPQQLKKASEQDWPPHSLLVYSSTPASIAVLVYSSTVPYHCCVQNTYITSVMIYHRGASLSKQHMQ